MSGSNGPTLAGFTDFIYQVMTVPPLCLPSNSPIIPMAYDLAVSMVNDALAALGGVYALAVYNLGGSTILNFAQDQDGRTYFKDLRTTLGINQFQPGLISSTGDASTSTSLLNPEYMQRLTLANLQQLKDPYGRYYLGLAQAYGESIVGLS